MSVATVELKTLASSTWTSTAAYIQRLGAGTDNVVVIGYKTHQVSQVLDASDFFAPFRISGPYCRIERATEFGEIIRPELIVTTIEAGTHGHLEQL